jgi:tetratricopeptide (TPR) repeat protein
MISLRIKYTFLFCSAFLLIIMLLASRSAGISSDEVLHYQQSVAVYNYFATLGADTTALKTPVTHLKYYGQSYDNLVTTLIRWLDLDDVYGFRHLMSSLMGWLVILITALFAIWMRNYLTGFIVLFLFAVSPTFLGHAQNNLKDVPFAFGYIASVFYIMKFLYNGHKSALSVWLLLLIYIAFAISIRSGGILLICYLIFFLMVHYLLRYLKEKKVNVAELGNKLILVAGVSIGALLLSTLLWPFALQNPFVNILRSYRVMADFPDTFRQIFEGRSEWSDFMPWYYLIKSMWITIPLIVFAGLLSFMLYYKRIFSNGKGLMYVFLIFTIVFPLVFVMVKNSNLYSSWRQFLFLYPGIVLLSAIGISVLFETLKKKYILWIAGLIVFLMSLHPLKFILNNHPYEYMYYNQLTGGLKGAYGNYETDYYYISQTEASQWLINYLKIKGDTTGVNVKATYSVKWQFRDNPGINTSYFRYRERSMSDWDYAIVANRYIPPYQLKNKIWPPDNAIHIVYADNIPLCAVLERKTKADYYGYMALNEGHTEEAIKFFEEVLMKDDNDEMVFYNFARALNEIGLSEKADSCLRRGLELNPDFEPILMYMGEIARTRNQDDLAIMYYERLISSNRKYFDAYIELSELMVKKDIFGARELLRTCLRINPRYIPAVAALAETYRETDPEIAKKYDEWARSIDTN